MVAAAGTALTVDGRAGTAFTVKGRARTALTVKGRAGTAFTVVARVEPTGRLMEATAAVAAAAAEASAAVAVLARILTGAAVACAARAGRVCIRGFRAAEVAASGATVAGRSAAAAARGASGLPSRGTAAAGVATRPPCAAGTRATDAFRAPAAVPRCASPCGTHFCRREGGGGSGGGVSFGGDGGVGAVASRPHAAYNKMAVSAGHCLLRQGSEQRTAPAAAASASTCTRARRLPGDGCLPEKTSPAAYDLLHSKPHGEPRAERGSSNNRTARGKRGGAAAPRLCGTGGSVPSACSLIAQAQSTRGGGGSAHAGDDGGEAGGAADADALAVPSFCTPKAAASTGAQYSASSASQPR